MADNTPRALAIVPASDEQFEEIIDRVFEQWAPRVPREVLLEHVGGILRQTPFGRTAQGWVLCPADEPQTKDFFVSCFTYRMPVLLAHPSEPSSPSRVTRSIGYAVSAVVCPPRHRRNGYAEQLMKLLHGKLAVDKTQPAKDHAGEELVEKGWIPNEAHLSVLFSGIGNYYARCEPTPWLIQGVETATWTTADLPPSSQGDPSEVTPLSAEDFERVAERDSATLRKELECLEGRAEPRFAVEPTKAVYEWNHARAVGFYKIFDLDLPATWGFTYSHSSQKYGPSFVLFTIQLKADAPGELKILRLRSNAPQDGAALLRAALHFAQSREEVGTVSAWNVPPSVLELLEGEGLRGVTGDREGNLSAVAWYGPRGEQAGEGGRWAEWLVNEQFAYC